MLSSAKRFRKSERYARWRTKVFKRDNYTCVVCGKKGGYLNAHHLNGYNKYKKQRTKVTNGVTLCFRCHSKFHYLYGVGNNTKRQFRMFFDEFASYKRILKGIKGVF